MYAPIGGGSASSQMSCDVVTECDRIFDALQEYEDLVRQSVPSILVEAKARGLTVGDELSFNLRPWSGDTVVAVERSTKMVFPVALRIDRATVGHTIPSVNSRWTPFVVEGFGGIADKRIVLDAEVAPRRCRFCGKTQSEATFRDEAHVIPFGLGNRTLLSRGECDSCNHRFGETIEIALQDFVGPLRTLSGIRGRNGFPTYRRRPDLPPIRFDAPKLILMNEEGKDDSVVLHHGSDGKSLSVEVECPPLDLQDVARALARIALFFLRTDADGPFFHLVQWARGEVSCYETSIFNCSCPVVVFLTLGCFP